MKFIIKTILTIILAYLFQLWLPWYSIAIAAIITSIIIPSKGFTAFLSGFVAIFLLWSITAHLIDSANQQILSSRIASIFSTTPSILLLATGLLGGLAAGFSSLTGNSFINLFKKDKNRNKYYS